MSDIDAESLLKTADPILIIYVSQLKSENLKLQKQILKQQAEAVTYQNRITALEEAVNKQPSAAPSINITLTQAPVNDPAPEKVELLPPHNE